MSDGSLRDDALQEMAQTMRVELPATQETLHNLALSVEEIATSQLPIKAEVQLRILTALLASKGAWEDGVWIGQHEATRDSLCLLSRMWAESFLDQLDKEDKR